MADTTHIEWTDATWNPITGCSIVDAGCTNCYAMQLAGTRLRNHPSRAGLTRVSGGRPKWTGEVRFNEQWLDQPLRWTRPRMIFVCAHGDLFHEAVPDDWIDRVFAVMAMCPRHTFQVLTKRPDRARLHLQKLADDGAADRLSSSAGDWFGDDADCFVANWINGWSRPQETPLDRNPANGTVRRWPLPNVWLGTSISDQASADLRIPHLLATPAAVRFLSAEPLLGPVNLLVTDSKGHDISALRGIGCDPTDPDGADEYYRTGKLDWVIVGGESGPDARPMHPDWARSLRDQCVAAGVPFFFKQWGEWLPVGDWYEDHHSSLPVRAWNGASWTDDGRTGGEWVARIGKRAAGRLLDGRTWDQMPGVRDG